MDGTLLSTAPTNTCKRGRADTSFKTRSTLANRRTATNSLDSIGNIQTTTILKSKMFQEFLKYLSGC